jgi:calcineurin-like phosphoesterase family protein
MRKIFYISDTHFSHENIIKFDNRPFKSVEEMNNTMLENWNSVVRKEDVVCILGDFIWKFKDEDFEFVKRLNGSKRLILGNHDRCKSAKFKNLFESITRYEKIKDGDKTIVLCHYPIVAYEGSYNGRNLHFYGHVHTTKEADIVLDCIKNNKSEEHPMLMYNV